MANKYLIGWSEVDMTPEKRIRLAGQFYERVSEYVETPLTATAMAIASGDTHVIMVSADLPSVGSKLVEDVRARIAAKNPAINTDAIIIAATHTHTSFVYADRSDSASGSSLEILKSYMPENCRYIDRVPTPDDVMKPEEASELIKETIVAACLEAFENMKPASFANEFGRAAVGMNRRVCYDDGTAKMWGDAKTVNLTLYV